MLSQQIIKDNKRRTVLLINAIAQDNIAEVQELLHSFGYDACATIYQLDQEGKDALTHAAKNPEILKILLAKILPAEETTVTVMEDIGFDEDFPVLDEEGHAVQIIKERFNHEEQNILLEQVLAIINKDITTLQNFLNSKLAKLQEPDKYVFYLLRLAVTYGLTEAVLALVERDNSVINRIIFSNDKTLLTLAVEGNHADIIEILINNGADINATYHSNTALMQAASKGHLDAINTLISLNASINQENIWGMTALAYAASAGKIEAINALVNNGHADVNYINKKSYFLEEPLTALMEAAKHGHVEVIKTLIRTYGAIVDQVSSTGQTALMKAAEHGRVEAVNTLIGYGANINQVDDVGQTALMKAATNPNWSAPSTLSVLIQKGAVVDQQDGSKQTALMLAIKSQAIEVVRFLISRNADCNKKTNNKNLTAVMIAEDVYNKAKKELINFTKKNILNQAREILHMITEKIIYNKKLCLQVPKIKLDNLINTLDEVLELPPNSETHKYQ